MLDISSDLRTPLTDRTRNVTDAASSDVACAMGRHLAGAVASVVGQVMPQVTGTWGA